MRPGLGRRSPGCVRARGELHRRRTARPRWFPPALLGAALSLLPVPRTWSGDGEIGLFFAADGFKCLETIPCAGTGRVYVYALLEGASLDGITTAEYSVQIGPDARSDPGWEFEEEFVPESSVLGQGAFHPYDRDTHQNPLVLGRGVNVGFPACMRGDGRRVLLETVEAVHAQCDSRPLQLLVVKHDYASNPFFQCPLFTLCDGPVFTKVCLGTNLHTCPNGAWPHPLNAVCSTSGRAIINPEPGQAAPCPSVAVATTRWGAMKQMYRK